MYVILVHTFIENIYTKFEINWFINWLTQSPDINQIPVFLFPDFWSKALNIEIPKKI